MKKLKVLSISIIIGILLSSAFLTNDVFAASTHIDLSKAEIFVVLAGSGITNTGATTITGDAGSSPTSTETGFAGLVTFTSGTNHTATDPQ